MTVRMAINGFGRIGRLVLRAAVETGRKDIKVVAINDLYETATLAHLLNMDRTPVGSLGDIVTAEDGVLEWRSIGRK